MTGGETSFGPLTALVLAASRQGFDDPVAKLQNKSHTLVLSLFLPMSSRMIVQLRFFLLWICLPWLQLPQISLWIWD